MGLRSNLFKAFVAFAVCAASLVAIHTANASIGIAADGFTYNQNFNSLAQTGTANIWTDGVTIDSWFTGRSTYRASTGTDNAGAIYSFGSTASSDRALGSVGSNTTGNIAWGVLFQNTSGLPIGSVEISYVGEEWRKSDAGSSQTLSFYYQVDNLTSPGPPATADFDLATSTADWSPFAALNFASPVFTAGAASALDGNLAANRTSLTSTIAFATPVAVGKWLWIGFLDINNPGNDHGLATDDFSAKFTTIAAAVPETSGLLVWSILCGSVLVGAKRRRDVA